MPTTELTADDLTDGAVTVIDLLVKTGLAGSKGEARRLIQQGGVALADQKVTDIAAAADAAALTNGVVLKKGKKIFHKVILK